MWKKEKKNEHKFHVHMCMLELLSNIPLGHNCIELLLHVVYDSMIMCLFLLLVALEL